MGVLVVFLGISYFALQTRKPQRADETRQGAKKEDFVHKHAAFLIFTKDTKREFTDTKYHERSEKVHLHASNPEIIHLHASGVTWQEFFDSLPMKLTQDCLTTGTGQEFCSDSGVTLKFYLDGEKVQDALFQEIKEGDRLLVSFGEKDEDLSGQLAQVADPQNVSLDPKE